MKKEAKETPEWGIILTIFIGVVVLVILVTFWGKKSISNYNECIDNIPSESWFEEDIANEISMRNFDILDIQDNGKGTAVVIIKTKSDYKDRIFYLWYEVKQKKFKFFWKLKRISGTL